MSNETNPQPSKRERATRLGMILIVVLANEAVVIGLLVLAMVWAKVDVTPATAILTTVLTAVMAAIGAVGGGGVAYSTADTLRPSGESWKGVSGAAGEKKVEQPQQLEEVEEEE